MTDKIQKIREEVERLKGWNNNVRNSTRHMTLQEEDFNRGKHSSYLEILNFIDSLQEEPVSEFLNTESMIESYKQRLISQANGMKNSPLIDMCLASYKHGINETLDTLNLSNVQRTVKASQEEPVSIWNDISEDAFIEKACEYLMEYEFNDSPTIADRRKRVEDFKNYLKYGKVQD